MTIRLATAALAALVMMAPAAAHAAPIPPANAVQAADRPDACKTSSTSAPCVNAWVADLDQARAKNGLPDYALPASFPALAPERQLLVLANLDRVAYGLPPVAGLNSTLDADALVGARNHEHPKPSLPATSFGANMATDYDNAAAAYFTWMWADGAGGLNSGCPSAGAAACWSHRKVLLRDGPQLMGAAMAPGATGYGLLMISVPLIGGALADAYTWDQAVADGAGTNTYIPGHLLTIVGNAGAVAGAGGAAGPCTGTCRSFQSDGTALTLTAAAAPRSVFLRWRGDACTGSAPTCTLTVNRDMTVLADYALAGLKSGMSTSRRSAKVSGRVTPGLKGRPVTVVFRRGAWKKTVTVMTRSGGVFVAKTSIPAGRSPVRAKATFAGISTTMKL
jgi:hypothetical protein